MSADDDSGHVLSVARREAERERSERAARDTEPPDEAEVWTTRSLLRAAIERAVRAAFEGRWLSPPKTEQAERSIVDRALIEIECPQEEGSR